MDLERTGMFEFHDYFHGKYQPFKYASLTLSFRRYAVLTLMTDKSLYRLCRYEKKRPVDR